MEDQPHRTPEPHSAYRRRFRPPSRPIADGYDSPYSCPAPPRPDAELPAGSVCPRCRTWTSCCFCAADPEGMRHALRRIAELHSTCDPDMCPERARLAAIARHRRPAE